MDGREPYSWRNDPSVPPFDDSHPIIVFDGVCVLCTGWAKFAIRHDKNEKFRFAKAQSPLGQALYAHFGYDTREFETNLVLIDGVLHTKFRTVIAVARVIGVPWSAVAAFGVLPDALLNGVYDFMARNRFKMFGRYDTCMVPTPEIRARFLD